VIETFKFERHEARSGLDGEWMRLMEVVGVSQGKEGI